MELFTEINWLLEAKERRLLAIFLTKTRPDNPP
jgi:hypothetical protein